VFNVGIPIPNNNNYLGVRLSISGSDITVPLRANVTVTLNGTSVSVTTPAYYARVFDTGTYALKKKVIPSQQFNTTQDLSYLLSQNELDNLYSSAGYTNNNWPFVEGDFDF
jgi:hypothetical protein